MEEETRNRVEAQRRLQEEALAAAAAQAERAAELDAAAAARVAAANAVREAVDAAEQEGFKRKAQQLKVSAFGRAWRQGVAGRGGGVKQKDVSSLHHTMGVSGMSCGQWPVLCNPCY